MLVDLFLEIYDEASLIDSIHRASFMVVSLPNVKLQHGRFGYRHGFWSCTKRRHIRQGLGSASERVSLEQRVREEVQASPGPHGSVAGEFLRTFESEIRDSNHGATSGMAAEELVGRWVPR